jgi:LmbE family N-acetylglucosaminyl deacetylase
MMLMSIELNKTKLKPKIKVLIVCPHPDDCEVLANQFCIQSIKLGNEVHELLSTCDEYGTEQEDFKGPRIQRIRRHEMIEASRVYGVDDKGDSLIHLHWSNYIDIHTPFNRESVERMKRFILKIQPTIIVGPDPFIQVDAHPDHINTGRNYYFALKRIEEPMRPKIMLFYQCPKPDFFLPIMYPNIIHKAQACHTSQFPPLLLRFMPMTSLFFSLMLVFRAKGRIVESYRKVTFNNSDHQVKGFQKIVRLIAGVDSAQEIRLVTKKQKDWGFILEPKEEIE